MGESWEYDAKWNNSDGKEQKPHDFTSIWNIKQKATNQQTKNPIDTGNNMVATRGERSWGRMKKVKGT